MFEHCSKVYYRLCKTTVVKLLSINRYDRFSFFKEVLIMKKKIALNVQEKVNIFIQSFFCPYEKGRKIFELTYCKQHTR